MSSKLFIITLFSILFGATNATYNWVTVVLVDFQLRDQCAQYWNDHQSCQNPSLRVIADLGEKRIASAAWPINAQLIREERLFFTSQWSMKIEKMLVSAQVEGENWLNPFGLAPKCDQGYSSMMFNESLTLKPGQTTNTRVAHIDAQCFTASLLIHIDNECPHCPKPVPTPIRPVASGYMATLEAALHGYDLQFINMILLCFSLFLIMLFLAGCQFVHRRPSIPIVTPLASPSAQAPIAVTNESAKIAKLRRIPTFVTRYEEIIDETATYGYRLKSQTISKIGFGAMPIENNDYETISTTSTDSTGYSIDF